MLVHMPHALFKRKKHSASCSFKSSHANRIEILKLLVINECLAYLKYIKCIVTNVLLNHGYRVLNKWKSNRA